MPVLYSLCMVLIALVLVSFILSILFYLAIIIEKEGMGIEKKVSIIDKYGHDEIDKKETVAVISAAIAAYTRRKYNNYTKIKGV